MAKIPIVLLAAGSSSRMGQPKQLLPWHGKTLIEHQIQTLLITGNPVVVVLGSKSKKIIPVLNNLDISFVINDKWESGMGSSVSTGVEFVMKTFSNVEGVLFTLIDQPLISPSHIKKIIENYKPEKRQIIASTSEKGWLGVPALFDKTYFKELASLNGEEGAKTIIYSHKDEVIQIDAGEILDDLDTIEKYRFMYEKYGH